MEWKALLLVFGTILVIALIITNSVSTMNDCEKQGGHYMRDNQEQSHCFVSIEELK